MKIKDLPDDVSLGSVKFKHPKTGEVCVWISQWNKGIWYKTDEKNSQMFPLFVENVEEALEFEVVE